MFMVAIVLIVKQHVLICGDMKFLGQLKDIIFNQIIMKNFGIEETIGRK